MNNQNNFLTRTMRLSRRCSLCNSYEHNITTCNSAILINFQTNLINRRDELREIHSIDFNNKLLYFETWLGAQDHHLIKSYAMRFCGVYSRTTLQICVSKITDFIWGIVRVEIEYNIVIPEYVPLPVRSIMDIPDIPLNYLDLGAFEFLDGLRNNRAVSNENKKFEINTVLCVELENLETKKECDICYEEKQIRHIVTLNCNHKFCGECVSQTLKKCNKFNLPRCAMCRTKIDCILVNDNEIMNTLKENIV